MFGNGVAAFFLFVSALSSEERAKRTVVYPDNRSVLLSQRQRHSRHRSAWRRAVSVHVQYTDSGQSADGADLPVGKCCLFNLIVMRLHTGRLSPDKYNLIIDTRAEAIPRATPNNPIH